MIIQKRCFLLMVFVMLNGCQIHDPPRVLPVLEFNQRSATGVNPASYYACGDACFPCGAPFILNSKKESKHVVNQSGKK